jgi:hypothetical protein
LAESWTVYLPKAGSIVTLPYFIDSLHEIPEVLYAWWMREDSYCEGGVVSPAGRMARWERCLSCDGVATIGEERDLLVHYGLSRAVVEGFGNGLTVSALDGTGEGVLSRGTFNRWWPAS